MMQPTVLDRAFQRRDFDPTANDDLHELKYFIENGRWRTTCPFVATPTCDSIPYMLMKKYVAHSLKDI